MSLELNPAEQYAAHNAWIAKVAHKQKKEWPPADYTVVFRERQIRFRELQKDPRKVKGALEYYRTRCPEFLTDWGTIYEPRAAFDSTKAKSIPFILFLRQKELVQFILECLRDQEAGLVEKSRDMGATWICVWVSIWLWLFWPGAHIGWGSRKAHLVDDIGDPDTIFEKIRQGIRGLPSFFHPKGFSVKDHMSSMKIVNPENGATITGEGGDNIGRGGRSLIYFKDESAHYEHPELIEAALSHNTAVPIDISSVHGTGNLFHNKREAGVEWYPDASLPKGRTRVFVFDWRDHPGKDQEWYDLGRAQKEREGLLHIWAQEVDRDYAAAVEGVIIPGIWVKAAIDAHLALHVDEEGLYCAALDVADEGGDTNALVARRGIVLTHAEEWGARDTGVTTRKAIALCRNMGEVELQYDCVGVGAGIKSEANRLKDDGHFPQNIYLVPWNGGAEVVDKDKPMIPHDRESPKNGDFFQNMKAQAWWALRRRFEITYRALNEPGFTWDTDDIISIPSSLPMLRKLEKELSQPTIGQSTRLKLLIDKKPDGMKSPNLADAVVMCFYPVKAKRGLKISDRVMRWAGLPEVGRVRR